MEMLGGYKELSVLLDSHHKSIVEITVEQALLNF